MHMQTLAVVLWLVGCLVLATPPATAADDTIEAPAGGLLFIPDERTVVEAQDVVIGRGSVKATYAVRNTSSDPIVRVVSFALPEIDMNIVGEEVVVVASADPRNFVGATVEVDGVAVALELEQHAVAFTRNVTRELEAAGIPLNPLVPGIELRLGALPPALKVRLEERGAIRRDDQRVVPNWAVRTTAFWRQSFDAGRTVTINLAYQPVTASGVWGADSLPAHQQAYCIGKDLQAAIAARAAQTGRGLVAHRVTYAAASEPGWWAPIPSFRLAIEKAGLETLVATCRKDLRAVGPTLLEWVGKNYAPGDDIRVLFIN
ncbi:MAG: DUF4424 family protein [Hyphomicrobiaceae bacterium]|nr:DUF4424 family protein [Hyphomicrobiaceae bacterium]